MGFIGDILQAYKTISIVGMAKNAGKTTALNYIIEEAYDEGFTAGVTSTGRDGEMIDVALGTDKPKVYLFEGTIVSVPTGLYELAETGLEILARTEYRTALGNVLICRVAESGHVQIAGPGSTAEHRKLCSDMLSKGAEIILIDGAVDRKSIASPDSSDAIILSTGAVISRSLKVVIEETVHIVNLYRSPVLEEGNVRTVLEKENPEKPRILLLKENGEKFDTGIRTGLGTASGLDDLVDKETRYIYIPGAFTESIIAGITPKHLSQVCFVLPDPTRIFIGASKWQQFTKRGLNVKVLQDIKIAGITVNPYAPAGYRFDGNSLRENLSEALGNIPVFDVRQRGFEL